MFEFLKKKEEKSVANVVSMEDRKKQREREIEKQIDEMVQAAAFIMAEEKFPNPEQTGGGGRGITRTGLVSAEAKKIKNGLMAFVKTRDSNTIEALLANKPVERGDVLVKYYNTQVEELNKEEQAA